MRSDDEELLLKALESRLNPLFVSSPFFGEKFVITLRVDFDVNLRSWLENIRAMRPCRVRKKKGRCVSRTLPLVAEHNISEVKLSRYLDLL